MSTFHFYHPIEVRYADIDAQGHVNSAAFFTYREQARTKYLQHLGLWDGRDFFAIGIILAEARCTFKAPIQYGEAIRVGVKTIRIGSRSPELAYSIRNQEGEEKATGSTVQESYDCQPRESVPVPEAWRLALEAFEGPPGAGSKDSV